MKRIVICLLFVLTILMIAEKTEAQRDPLPNGVLDVNDIIKMIDSQMPHWKKDDLWQGQMWIDRWYRKTTVPEMIEYTKKATKAAKQLRWLDEAGDCDDAAIMFKAELVKQTVKRGGENPIPAGIIIMTDDNKCGGVHAMIWFVDDEMQMWLIEPRGGWMQHWTEFPNLRVVWMMG